MITPEQIIATVHHYFDAFDKETPEAMREIFAEDAVVEDPVGTPPHGGIEDIVTFYTNSMRGQPKLKLDGAIRTAGNFAAFAFNVTFADPNMLVEVIDTFEFNDAGKVKHMRAYFGPQNMKGFPADFFASNG